MACVYVSISLKLWKVVGNFTTLIILQMIMKQAIQVVLIILIGIDVCYCVHVVCEETRVVKGNLSVWLGDHIII